MATNTIAGLNIDRLAEKTLDYLGTEGISLSAFTTDLQGDVMAQGETVTTRFPSGLVTQDFSSSTAAQNAVTTARQVTLDQFRGVPIEFTDLERTYTDAQLDELFVGPAMSALVDKIINDALALATTANGFNTDQTVSLASGFNADKVADIAQTLSENKVPKAPRNLIIPPAYLATLVKDGAIQDASSYGSPEAIRENRVPRLHGFNILEYNGTIPSNSQNMTGMACSPQAFLIAARAVAEPEAGTWAGQVRSIVEPNTGMPIQIRKVYENNRQYVSWSTLYGVQIGLVPCASRIVSA